MLRTSALVALASPMALAPVSMAASQEENTSFEEIVVTGSYIKQDGFDSPSPMEVLGMEDIAASGAPTMGDIVKNLTINTGSQFNHDFANSGAFGSAQFNLRGLGLGSTLTLVNGRRVTLTAVDQGGVAFVDVNQFPVNMVERVEIVKDGAASLYGSDAVAGVVNLITREVNGVEIEANYLRSTNMKAKDGSGDNTSDYSISGAIGGGNERGRFDAFFSHFTRSGVMDNEIFNGLLTSFGAPGAFRLKEDVVSGPYAGLTAGTIVQDPDCGDLGGLNPSDTGLGLCRHNLAPESFHFIPDERRTSVFAKARYDVNDGLSVFGETSYARTTADVVQNETNGFIRQALVVPADHPDNIFGVPVDFLGRFTIKGREIAFENQYFRGMAGTSYEFENGWYVEAAYVYSQDTINRSSIRTIVSLAQDAVNGVGGPDGDGLLNPFGSALTGAGTANDQDLIDFVAPEAPMYFKSSLQTIDAHATGTVVDLPAGPLAVAFGGQYRKDRLQQRFDSNMLVDVDGTYAPVKNLPQTSLDVWAGFVEVAVPILEDLDLSASLRHEDFGGGTGSTTDPKITLRWTPLEEVMVRGTYATGFRAPSILQTSTPLSSGAINVVDPFSGTPGQCDGTETVVARTNTSGNADLKPEDSRNYNVGVVVRPTKGLQVSVDYWRFKYKDIIGLTSAQAIINNDCLADGIRNDPRVVMDPTGSVIQEVNVSFVNQSSVKTSGLDFQGVYNFTMDTAGIYSIGLNISHVMEFDIQEDPLAPVIDGAGSRNKLNGFSPAPELRGNAAIAWTNNGHSANLIARYVDSVEDDLNNETIPSRTTFDAQYSYLFDEAFGADTNVKITAGMMNITNRKAPNVAGEFIGFLSNIHDPRGRLVYLNLRTAF